MNEGFNCLARHGYNIKRIFRARPQRSRQPARDAELVRLQRCMRSRIV